MTLIEVLAALLLMGSILVALVTARGRLVNQHAQAVAIQDAVRAADTLLAAWWATDPPSVPVGGRGEVANHEGWIWATEPVGGSPEGLEVQVVRLSIIDERDPAYPRKLAEVELLVPIGAPGAGSVSSMGTENSTPSSLLAVRP